MEADYFFHVEDKIIPATAMICDGADLCDGHCDQYVADQECEVWFCKLNATGG